MIIFFCPVCWKEIKETDKICPFCGANISDYENKGFEEKLINALRHRERETVQRAVYILGSRKSAKAVQPLLKLFKHANSTLLKIGILEALHKIGAPEAREFIFRVINSEVGIIKRMAQEIINKEFINHNE